MALLDPPNKTVVSDSGIITLDMLRLAFLGRSASFRLCFSLNTGIESSVVCCRSCETHLLFSAPLQSTPSRFVGRVFSDQRRRCFSARHYFRVCVKKYRSFFRKFHPCASFNPNFSKLIEIVEC